MANSNYLTKFKPSGGSDPARGIEKDNLGPAAETAEDLAAEGSGKELLEPTSDEPLAVENSPEVVSQRIIVTLDPICGISVDDQTALQLEFDGKIFYFCSKPCLQTFLTTVAGAKPDTEEGS